MTEAEKREMLEMAAKAVGLQLTWGEKYKIGDDEVDCTDLPYALGGSPDVSPVYWNPIEDDGDALRLAVKLGLSFAHYPIYEQPKHAVIVYRRTLGDDGESHVTEAEALERYCGDPCTATRLAITRAAAEIGRQMQSAEGAGETS